MQLHLFSIRPSISSQWRYNEYHGVSNHQCLLNRLFRCTSKKTSKAQRCCPLWGDPPVTVGFPSKRASNAENVSIWWRHQVGLVCTAITVVISTLNVSVTCWIILQNVNTCLHYVSLILKAYIQTRQNLVRWSYAVDVRISLYNIRSQDIRKHGTDLIWPELLAFFQNCQRPVINSPVTYEFVSRE